MIQDILPHHYKNAYYPHSPRPDDFVLDCEDHCIKTRKDHTFYQCRDLSPDQKYTYLFEIDETAFFLADLSAQDSVLLDIRSLRTYQPRYLAFAAVTGWQISTWMKQNAFCGRCGSPMVPDKAERAMRCPVCGNLVYPRINPAVIVGILNQDRILVTKYAHGSYQNYALVAGYAETGETIEETVHREVKEETGLDVTDLRFYKSQPWSFTQTLLFGFWCHVSGSDVIRMDTNELRAAEWHVRTDRINDSDDASLTHEMIDLFQKGKVS